MADFERERRAHQLWEKAGSPLFDARVTMENWDQAAQPVAEEFTPAVEAPATAPEPITAPVTVAEPVAPPAAVPTAVPATGPVVVPTQQPTTTIVEPEHPAVVPSQPGAVPDHLFVPEPPAPGTDPNAPVTNDQAANVLAFTKPLASSPGGTTNELVSK